MSDPQPTKLNRKPRRAQPLQPDRPNRRIDRERDDQGTGSASDRRTGASESEDVPARNTSKEDITSSVSPEGAIARNPMTGNKPVDT